MALLLDTSAAIVLRDAETSADDRLVALGSIPALSIVSRVELEGGITANPLFAAQRRASLDAMLAVFPVIAFDRDCADAYRRIVEAAGFSRRKVIDRMIAATALVHGLKVITTNGKDFADVPGLQVDVWPVE